jgi:hypothetical protein
MAYSPLEATWLIASVTVKESLGMVTRDNIRRARPTVDSPLGRLIKGEINKVEYEIQIREKRAREGSDRPTKQAAENR